MTHDEPLHPHLLARPLHREPVKAVAPDMPLRAPALGHRVGGRLDGHGRVELGVEYGDLRHGGNARRVASIASSAGALCRGARSTSARNSAQRRVVQQHRRAKGRAAVDDAMADRHDVAGRVAERRERAALPRLVDRRELEARRAGIDDEDARQAISPATSSRRRRAGPRRARACRRGCAAARPACPAGDGRSARTARGRDRSRPSRGGSGRGR